MAKRTTITIGKTAYPLQFGYGAIKLLGQVWGLPGYAEVLTKVGTLVPTDGDTANMLHFDVLESIADVVWAGVANASDEDEGVDLPRDVIVDWIFEDMSRLTEVFALFQQSMPQAKGQPEPVKKNASRAKAKAAAKKK